MSNFIQQQLLNTTKDSMLVQIAENIFNNKRINQNEGVYLFQHAELSYLSVLANHVKEKHTGRKIYFNRNVHIEPTNICVYNCKFCSYCRKEDQEGSWDYSVEEMLDIARKYVGKKITEIHIVGGVHPKRDVHYYGTVIKEIKKLLPNIHIKALSAIEIYFIAKISEMDIRTTLQTLKDYGLDSIPGGGAEIFDQEIRSQICPDKANADEWLTVHKVAHELGIASNATILYGHIENYKHRIDHLNKLRELQDKTTGFGTFIPLKFKRENNFLSHITETSMLEDLKNYAISRIYLDNFPHIKAYWPMTGRNLAQIALSFGVDDIDGTIDDSTKIYSMAGADDKTPKMSTENLVQLIKDSNRIPVERDTLFNEINTFN